jgi:thiol-disulfide isomerase/thioredoxin
MNPTGPRFVGAAVIMLAAIWAGTRLYASRHAPDHGAVAVPAGEASAPDPTEAAALNGPAARATVPELLPSFSLLDQRGKATPISAWSGKSLVINFWATWCAPCRREIPLLKTLSGEWGTDMTVIGIAVDYRDKVQEFARQFSIDYPLLVGEQDALDVAAQFGMESPAFPFTVFTDRRGQVVALFVGELHRPQVNLILSVVRNLNQDRLRLADAKRTIAEGLSKLAENSPG